MRVLLRQSHIRPETWKRLRARLLQDWYSGNPKVRETIRNSFGIEWLTTDKPPTAMTVDVDWGAVVAIAGKVQSRAHGKRGGRPKGSSTRTQQVAAEFKRLRPLKPASISDSQLAERIGKQFALGRSASIAAIKKRPRNPVNRTGAMPFVVRPSSICDGRKGMTDGYAQSRAGHGSFHGRADN